MRQRTRPPIADLAPIRGTQILYADPPWLYDDKAHSGKRGVDYHYQSMKLSEIARLDIPSIMADAGVCFMWATCPLLDDCIETLKIWGFDYKTVAFVWVKKNSMNMDTDFMGMGNWSRANAELLLLGTFGDIRRLSKSVRQIVRYMEENPPTSVDRRILAQSEKPHVFRERIHQLMGSNLKSVELFSRHVVPGWESYGHGIQGDSYDIRHHIGLRDENILLLPPRRLFDKR